MFECNDDITVGLTYCTEPLPDSVAGEIFNSPEHWGHAVNEYYGAYKNSNGDILAVLSDGADYFKVGAPLMLWVRDQASESFVQKIKFVPNPVPRCYVVGPAAIAAHLNWHFDGKVGDRPDYGFNYTS